MLDKLIFYNHYGNGDVHYSREFVKDIMKKVPAKKYEYYHRHNIGILKDIKNLESFTNIFSMNYSNQQQISFVENLIIINTWVGQQSAKYLKYNCSMYSNYLVFIDIYKQLNIEIENIDYYISSIDFNYIETENIDNFINDDKIKILFSNGNVFSGQAQNFNFDIIIDRLSSYFKDVEFILTHDSNIKKNNIIKVSDVIKINGNLNEIGYLSTFCDIIIGRASGPYCFTQIKDNFFDENITFISFSNDNREGLYYGFSDDFIGKKPLSKMIHSSDYNYESIFNIIKNEIESII